MKTMCGFGSLGSLFTMLTKLLRRNEKSTVEELKKKNPRGLKKLEQLGTRP